VHARAREAFAIYMSGIEQALTPARRYLVGDDVTLADICFVAEFTLFSNERPRARSLAEQGLDPILQDAIAGDYPRAMAHYDRLCRHAAFAPDVGPYLAKLAAKAA
jgi:glutathione S-transferase